MKTTILIGYTKTDASGNPMGPASIVSGPPATETEARAQGKLFSDAKQLHRFPKGIKFLAFCTVDQADAAAHISDEVSKQVAAREEARQAAVAEQLEIRATVQKKSTALAEAQKRISKAAVDHNNASAALGIAKRRLEDAEANLRVTKTKSAEEEVARCKDRVAECNKAEVDAKFELNEAKQAKAELLAPKERIAEATPAAEITETEPGGKPKGFFARLAGK
jgi:flagellin-like hook-associated protein FlgL